MKKLAFVFKGSRKEGFGHIARTFYISSNLDNHEISFFFKGDSEMLDRFKDKNELLEDEFEKFITIYQTDINKYLEERPESDILKIKNYFKAYATDETIRTIINTKDFVRLNTNSKLPMRDFKILNGWRDIVPEYIKDYVSVNRFMV